MSVTFDREYRTIDKSAWGDGPWNDEPDKVQWVDAATGLDCLIVRTEAALGHLCGYVGVPPGHPWHGRSYDESGHVCDSSCDEDYCDKRWAGSPDVLTSVHGGLTFASKCEPGATEAEGICHVPDEGRPDDVWWFGFDCAHCDDVSPGLSELGFTPFPQATYKPIEYVTGEVERLAAQLAEVAA